MLSRPTPCPGSGVSLSAWEHVGGGRRDPGSGPPDLHARSAGSSGPPHTELQGRIIPRAEEGSQTPGQGGVCLQLLEVERVLLKPCCVFCT